MPERHVPPRAGDTSKMRFPLSARVQIASVGRRRAGAAIALALALAPSAD